ncbi:hypothetical protein FRACA_2640006 [Frankia canadensis]|uniref:Uncharacterized protein n=1 Tax=Frankia canadensis TaxID=1836972 RepID=A0A2I2KSL1_9ACTN|nr:hypothetical protein FRACA_2640006 [Frankia canadensis]SOU55930.1 hypothetical protein FRACA_2640006 [Frankia canadensis]
MPVPPPMTGRRRRPGRGRPHRPTMRVRSLLTVLGVRTVRGDTTAGGPDVLTRWTATPSSPPITGPALDAPAAGAPTRIHGRPYRKAPQMRDCLHDSSAPAFRSCQMYVTPP